MADPLDSGDATVKRWEEFRAQYGAVVLSHQVFRDLKAEAADVVADLWGRLQSSLCDYPELMQREAEEQGEPWDQHVPLHGRDDTDIAWCHIEDLRAIYQSLFPHDLRNASIESAMAGATVIGLHSALEVYANAVGVDTKKGLDNGIRTHLRGKGESLPADLVEVLDDCDATRHILVHNRGSVDDAYLRRVRHSPFQDGETRVLTNGLIHSFSRAVLAVAELLRKHHASEAAV